MVSTAPLVVPGLKPGLKCSVEIENPTIGEVVTYATMIEEVDSDLVSIGWPIEHGELVEVSSGSHVQVAVPTSGGATLFMDCEVMRRRPSTAAEPIATLGLRVLAVGRQQQRSHFRLSIVLPPLDCVIWQSPTTQEGAAGAADADVTQAAWHPVQVSIADISGGGVGLRSRHELPEGALLRLRFPYPMGDGIFVGDARVMSVIPITGGEQAHYKIGTAFDESVDRLGRERLARSIMRYQLEQRRRQAAR